MTQKEKSLLLQDLCARLFYGVIVNHKGLIRPLYSVSPTKFYQVTLDSAIDGEHNGLEYVSLDIDAVELKPYLRPMSSMTQCECTQLYMLLPKSYIVYPEEIHNIDELTRIFPEHIEIITDFYNSHYIDWRGLIPKGLALEAPKDMYNN